MCGRFNITDDQKIHDLLQDLDVDLGPFPQRYNLAPTDQVPVIHYWEGQRLISDMRWWLVPNWAKEPTTKFAMFNARGESLSTSRAYQGSFRHKRCIIPAHSFVEWRRDEGIKTPFLFSSPDNAIAFAGIWDYWTDGIEHILSCAIVTTKSVPEFTPYYKRMPIMLNESQAKQWLTSKHIENLFPLFEAPLPYPLQASELDPRINNARYKKIPILLTEPIPLT